ncbi:MAG: hypothetical protein ABI843_16730, partial [Dokdonella sp.]
MTKARQARLLSRSLLKKKAALRAVTMLKAYHRCCAQARWRRRFVDEEGFSWNVVGSLPGHKLFRLSTALSLHENGGVVSFSNHRGRSLMKLLGTLVLAGVACLSGCAEMERMNAQAVAQQRAADQQKCSGYGYAAGTDAFADCMMSTEHRREQQRQDAERQAAMDRQREQDRRAKKEAAAAQAQQDADTQRQIKFGEDLENDEARKAGLAPSPTEGMNCTTTT